MKKYCFIITFLLCCAFSIAAQSTNIEYPTPISSSEIRGKIRARDIGDSRLTSHYYVFDGQQGDIFINIEANNFNGDIDVFLEKSLKPLTKISLFAESTPTQTGREIYLRKSERMILRIEGRSPNDDEASYLIKFTGSFQAVATKSVKEEPKLPEVKVDENSDVVVNSVGTIIETKVKEPKVETVEKITKGKRPTKAKTATTPKAATTAKAKKAPVTKIDEIKTKVAKTEEPKKSTEKTEVVVNENLPKTDENGETATTEKVESKAKTKKKVTAEKTPKLTKAQIAAQAKAKATEELTKALENIRLVVLFKDGAIIERPMNDVVKFGVDKGILTIVSKDGSIGRYSIVEITKISVE